MDLTIHLSDWAVGGIVVAIVLPFVVKMFLAMSFEKPRTPEN